MRSFTRSVIVLAVALGVNLNSAFGQPMDLGTVDATQQIEGAPPAASPTATAQNLCVDEPITCDSPLDDGSVDGYEDYEDFYDQLAVLVEFIEAFDWAHNSAPDSNGDTSKQQGMTTDNSPSTSSDAGSNNMTGMPSQVANTPAPTQSGGADSTKPCKTCFACAYDEGNTKECAKFTDLETCRKPKNIYGGSLCGWNLKRNTCLNFGAAMCYSILDNPSSCPQDPSDPKVKPQYGECFPVLTATTWDKIKEMYESRGCTKKYFYHTDHGRGEAFWENIKYCSDAGIDVYGDLGCETFNDITGLYQFLIALIAKGQCAQGTIYVEANQDRALCWHTGKSQGYRSDLIGLTRIRVRICNGKFQIMPDVCDFENLCGFVNKGQNPPGFPMGYCTDCTNPDAPEISCKACDDCPHADRLERSGCGFKKVDMQRCDAKYGGPFKFFTPVQCPKAKAAPPPQAAAPAPEAAAPQAPQPM